MGKVVNGIDDMLSNAKRMQLLLRIYGKDEERFSKLVNPYSRFRDLVPEIRRNMKMYFSTNGIKDPNYMKYINLSLCIAYYDVEIERIGDALEGEILLSVRGDGPYVDDFEKKLKEVDEERVKEEKNDDPQYNGEKNGGPLY